MSPMPRQKPGESKQDYRTPKLFLAAVRSLLQIEQFGFDFAASAKDTVALAYWTKEADSLTKTFGDWNSKVGFGEWGWLNPPFGHLDPWVEYCAEAGELGCRIALLVPASVGANWYKRHVHDRAYVLFLNGRLSFDGIAPYPKDCMLCLFGGYGPGSTVWSWQ